MLTRNFKLAEFIRSDKADEMGDPNTPDEEHLRALHGLACGMEQVRRILGDRPISITSGYRNPAVNKAVGGVSNSAHALGYAADFSVKGMTPVEVARALDASTLAFDQLIYEASRNINHISFDPRMRREVKTQKKGAGTPVVWGLVDSGVISGAANTVIPSRSSPAVHNSPFQTSAVVVPVIPVSVGPSRP